jgi:serine/threonine protein kinase
VFARKIIHPVGSRQKITTEVENERRVIEKFRENGGHENIVTVLDHGWLREEFYFIDMDICAFSLREFIDGAISRKIGSRFWTLPRFADDDECLYFWSIVDHIVRGLGYIHDNGELHRNIKPENGEPQLLGLFLTVVLLCLQSRLWKITDFGITSEGMSQKAYSTRHGRGTQGYRAPELVLDDSIFSKKSDIFALGCILFELVSGEKLFASDFQIRDYTATRQTPELPQLEVCKKIASYVAFVIIAMLEVDWWRRPSAREILVAMRPLSHELTEFIVPELSRHVLLGRDSVEWRLVQWVPFWYAFLINPAHFIVALDARL